jgi:histidinol-phosphate aminotransferase
VPRKARNKKGKGTISVPSAKAGTDYKVYDVPPDCIRMDLNTNLLGPNPAVTKVIRTRPFETHQYPSPDSDELREALAKEWKVDPGHLVCGNGVDDMISLSIRALTEKGDRVAYPTPSFSMYKFFARAHRNTIVEVPLKKGFEPDIDGLLKADARLTLIANPNNPSGNKFSNLDLERLLNETGGMVAIDEAYIEYSGGSFIGRLEEFPNMVILRTFSKAYAMAGLRVGVAAASGGIDRLKRLKPPFNLDVVSEAAALAALKNKVWLDRTLGVIRKERPRVQEALGKMGFKVHPSVTNFLLCGAPMDSEELCLGLAAKGVLIKDFGGVPGLEGHVRITIGAKKHNDALLKGVKEVLEHA